MPYQALKVFYLTGLPGSPTPVTMFSTYSACPGGGRTPSPSCPFQYLRIPGMLMALDISQLLLAPPLQSWFLRAWCILCTAQLSYKCRTTLMRLYPVPSMNAAKIARDKLEHDLCVWAGYHLFVGWFCMLSAGRFAIWTWFLTDLSQMIICHSWWHICCHCHPTREASEGWWEVRMMMHFSICKKEAIEVP